MKKNLINHIFVDKDFDFYCPNVNVTNEEIYKKLGIIEELEKEKNIDVIDYLNKVKKL